MILLVFLLCSGAAKADLRADFSGFIAQFGEDYPRPELKHRLALFEESEKEINTHNSDPDRSWSMGINQFSAMTPDERSQFTGLGNVSETVEAQPAEGPPPSKNSDNPSTVDHVGTLVTRPKDQRTCGSCWAFAATAAFEGAYAEATGVLKSFSEKELLDCTYEGRRDGCKGGWYEYAWGYIGRSGRFAALKDAPYDYAKDRECSYGNVQNGLKNVIYSGRYKTLRPYDEDLEDAVAKHVVAVAMIVEQDFFSYSYGIYNGCGDNRKQVGHAVTLVGYTQGAWKVKNSWGSGWGEGGYVRFSRSKRNICKLAQYAKYPLATRDPKGEQDEADPSGERRRWSHHGCNWGDDYPCSDLNCSYGCSDGTCWNQCNGFCAITGNRQRCENCDEWCWLDVKCNKHEDCFSTRYKACHSACSV